MFRSSYNFINFTLSIDCKFSEIGQNQ
uniref:Uncharacterized protein n=1 Tax=Rhizophora mucronata TaxID=61149 RepID=A0A2P2P7C6_RHIMU